MSLAGWDSGGVTVSSKSMLTNEDEWGSSEGLPNTNRLEISQDDATKRFLHFIRNFQVDNVFIYRYGFLSEIEFTLIKTHQAGFQKSIAK